MNEEKKLGEKKRKEKERRKENKKYWEKKRNKWHKKIRKREKNEQGQRQGQHPSLFLPARYFSHSSDYLWEYLSQIYGSKWNF